MLISWNSNLTLKFSVIEGLHQLKKATSIMHLRFTQFFIFYLALLYLITNSNDVFASVDDIVMPESIPKDYVFGLYGYNHAIGKSQSKLGNHNPSLGVSYQHRLSHPWLVTVGYRPQSFINLEKSRPTTLLSLFSSTQRIFRVYHPLYLMAGTSILYLIPVYNINPPITKDADFSTELALGLQITLWYQLSNSYALLFDLERWRGTKTDQLHGLSMNLGLGYGF